MVVDATPLLTSDPKEAWWRDALSVDWTPRLRHVDLDAVLSDMDVQSRDARNKLEMTDGAVVTEGAIRHCMIRTTSRCRRTGRGPRKRLIGRSS